MREIFDRHQERMTGAEERRVREAMFAALDRRRPAWRRWAVPGAALAAAGAAVFAVALSLRGPADHIITDRFAQELAPGKEIETAPSAEPTLDATRERTMGAVDPPEPDAHPDDHPAAGAVGRDAAASAPEPDLGLSAEAKAEARRRAMEPRPVEGVTIVEQQRTVHTMAGEEREHLRVDRLPNAAPEGKKNEARERWPVSVGGTDPVNGQAYDAMFFRHYGVNPFVDPQEDRFATFAMDVDNASYAVTRSYLERGELPPPEAVRVEEFVNAIHHDYAPPGHGDIADRDWAPSDHGTFAIHLEAAHSPFGDGLVLLRVGLKGREIDARARKPVVLTFVIDTSGSMERENRLGLVKRSLGMLLDQLDRDDAVGIVTFGTDARVVLPTTSVRYRRDIEEAIARLYPNGSTNAAEGLRRGYEMAARAFERGAVNRVILCSDGVANTGLTGADDILAVIEREAGRGIELTAIGVGMGNFNDIFLEQLADRGDGNYFYVDEPDEARRVFVDNLTGTLQTIAKDAKIQVEFDPGNIRRYRLLGYENRAVADRDFRNDAVDAGEVGAGHEVTALFEAKLEKDARGDLATVRIRYEDAESGRVVEEARTLRVKDIERRLEQASPSFRMDAAAAEFAEILRGSYWAKDGDLSRVLGLARSAARAMGSPSDAEEMAGLVERARELSNRVEPPVWNDDYRPLWEPDDDHPQRRR